MKILLLNQAFYPDVVSTAQHLTDLAVDLVERGHDITAIAGRSAYDGDGALYTRNEVYKGVHIKRVRYSALGKKSRFSRAIDVTSFNLGIAAKLWFARKFDVVIVLTSPPFLALVGLLYAMWRGARFVYWIMDLNPDEAVAAGWLRKGSKTERTLEALSRSILRRSSQIVVLDRFMAQRIVAKGPRPEKVTVLPPWPHDSDIRPIAHEQNPFRNQQGLAGKFVVMYSGNHSPCHPLDTLLDAACRLKNDSDIVFVFVGGGTGVEQVRRYAQRHCLKNIKQLPYQPRSQLGYSLSAADLHVVTMGNGFVGIVHPCKVYGVLCTGRPFVFIGPKMSHIGDLILQEAVGYHVEHNDVEGLIEIISLAKNLGPTEKQRIFARNRTLVEEKLSRRILSSRLAQVILGNGKSVGRPETRAVSDEGSPSFQLSIR